jgi:sigma-B regulation protein RsbU (phosphoserine phosphatase)
MLSAVTMAARNVAGDYYDFLDLDDGRLAIALADVSGKGIPAALIMSVVQASLRIISTDASLPLPTLASRMNDFIYRSTQSNSYATFFYGRLDERSLELQFVNAGHNPPMLARARDGAATIEELRAGGTVLGLFPVAGFDSDSVMLERGDVLLIFTDGVPESLNTTGDEFGEERLKQVLREGITLTAGELADLLSRELTQWSAGAPQHDDLTFVVMKVERPTA